MASALVSDVQKFRVHQFCHVRTRTDPCCYRGFLSERLTDSQELSTQCRAEDSESDTATQPPAEDTESDSDLGGDADDDCSPFCNVLTDEGLTYAQVTPTDSSSALMRPMQQAAYFHPALDGLKENGTDPELKHVHSMNGDIGSAHMHVMQQASFASVASPMAVSMAPPCPLGKFFPAGSIKSPSLDCLQGGAVHYLVQFALPVAFLHATSVVTQPTQPANMVSSMPTLLASDRYHNARLPNAVVACTTALDTAVPVPSGEFKIATDGEVRTSLLLRNLPDGFTRSRVMDMMHAQGLAASVDFLYAPGNLKVGQNCGYAFVNFTTPEAAVACLEMLHGFSDWGVQSEMVCEVTWCIDHQGLNSHVERYRNSRIMHESVNDEFKPAVFKNGIRKRFPIPSKPLHAPRLRKA